MESHQRSCEIVGGFLKSCEEKKESERRFLLEKKTEM